MRRLQRRMTKLLPAFSGKWPEKLTITIEWRRLHEGGLDDIRSWYEHVKAKGGKPILAVIDVLAKVRKPTGNKPVYEADYEALSGLHRLAHELSWSRSSRSSAPASGYTLTRITPRRLAQTANLSGLSGLSCLPDR